MREYKIWSEGYAATGNSSGAVYHGVGFGKTFKEACSRFFALDRTGNYNENSLTYWGCRLYEHESQARRSFG